MNIKIARTLLVLCIVYMVGFYVLKFIFPDYLILAITDETVLNLGKFIESNAIYLHIYYFVSTFITFYLFVVASSGRFKLKFYELLLIIAAVVVNRLVTDYLPELMVHTSTSLMFLLALLCRGKIKYAVPSFMAHGFLSQFLFEIRGFDAVIYKINIASGFVMSLECFAWLILFGLIFYLREKKNGKYSTTIYEQNG